MFAGIDGNKWSSQCQPQRTKEPWQCQPRGRGIGLWPQGKGDGVQEPSLGFHFEKRDLYLRLGKYIIKTKHIETYWKNIHQSEIEICDLGMVLVSVAHHHLVTLWAHCKSSVVHWHSPVVMGSDLGTKSDATVQPLSTSNAGMLGKKQTNMLWLCFSNLVLYQVTLG